MDKDIYTEQIEAYILNKLDIEDKIAFRQLIEKDPILKSELQFQEEIIEAIRLNRKMEMKARLDAIPVNHSPLSQLSRLVLFGTAAVSLGLWLTLSILQINPFAGITTHQTPQSTALLAQKPKALQSEINTTRKPTPNNQVKSLIQQESVSVNPKNKVNSVKPLLSEKSPIDLPEHLDAKQELATPNPYDLNTRVNKPRRFMSKVDNIQDAQKETFAFEIEEEEDVKGVFDGTNEVNLEEIAHRNQLSYQYYNDQLFLYNHQGGSKLIRTTIGTEERHFLYYQNQFYELNTYQIEKKELRAITDVVLIEKLKEVKVKLYGK